MKKNTLMALFMGLCFLAWLPAQAQTKTISGKVTATDGNALPGVNIILKGGTVGTVTDVEGNYRLSIPSETGKLVFSFVGYLAQTLDVPATGDLSVVLAEDLIGLEEVVITGLASNVKRSNLANAVSSISAKELVGTTSPVTTDGALQGKIAGANIQANGSVPGGGFNIQFRGLSTLGASASQPLFIVDGVYIDNSQNTSGRSQANKATGGSTASAQDNNANRLADLNPDDIENIEILKGASAAAIYGTRANAGVVIITTKRGKGGKTKISFGQDLGFSKAYAYYGGSDWTEDKLTQYFDAGDIPLLRDAKAKGSYTDWEKVLYGETGQIRNTRLSVTGGDDKTRFFLNGSIADETGIIKNTGFQRYSLRANIDHKVTKWLEIGIGSNLIHTNNDRGWTGNDNSYVNYGYSLPYSKPYINLYPNDKGIYPNNPVGENPLAIRDRAVNNQKVTRFLQSFYANISAINKSNMSLTFKLNGGLDYQNGYALTYLPSDLQSQKSEPNPGFAQDTRNEVTNYNVQAAGVFTYAAMENKLNLTSSAGIVQLGTLARVNYVRGRGLPANISNPARAVALEQDVEIRDNTDQGVFLQQEANYDDKIIAAAGIRFDRSNLNSDQNKWYAFPRGSLAANIANFGNWSKNTPVSQLKLRVAYGETAGLPAFGNLYSRIGVEALSGLGGAVPQTTLGNTNLKPERATELEYGLDFALFGGRITGEFTLYNKKVYDLIRPLLTAPTSGVVSIPVNAADLENTGIEVSLGAEVIKNNKITWFIQPIFWFNRSKITRLTIPEALVGGFGTTFGQWRVKDGQSPTQIVGDPRTNSADANSWTVYGDQQPKFELSLNQRITFLKNFEFSMLAHYRHEFTVVSLSRVLWDEGGNTYNWNETDQSGNPETPNGIYRQDINGLDENGRPKPGYNPVLTSFLKIREIALYYRIPKEQLNKAFGKVVEGVRVGFSGNNLFRWTDYTAGYDPENSNFGSASLGSGVDIGSAPFVRRMMFHLSVEF